MAATRRTSSVPSINSQLLQESYESFKRKHLSQNKEIIHKNSELTKANSDLLLKITQLRHENLELKGSRFKLECELAGVRDKLDRAEAKLANHSGGTNATTASQGALVQSAQQSIAALQALLSSLAASAPLSPPASPLAPPAQVPTPVTMTSTVSRRNPSQPRASISAQPELSFIGEDEDDLPPEQGGNQADAETCYSPFPEPRSPSPPTPPPAPLTSTQQAARNDPRRPGRRVSGLLLRRQEEPLSLLSAEQDDTPDVDQDLLDRILARATREREKSTASSASTSLKPFSPEPRTTTTSERETPPVASTSTLPRPTLSAREQAREARRQAARSAIITVDPLPTPPGKGKARQLTPESPEELPVSHYHASEAGSSNLSEAEANDDDEEDVAPPPPPPRMPKVRASAPTGRRRTTIAQEVHGTIIESAGVDPAPSANLKRAKAKGTIPAPEEKDLALSTEEVSGEAGAQLGDGEATGEGRRARKSVNYALPKLNTKMRRPEGYVPTVATTKKAKPRNSSSIPPSSFLPAPLSLDASRSIGRLSSNDELEEQEGIGSEYVPHSLPPARHSLVA